MAGALEVPTDADLLVLAEQLAAGLRARGWRAASAESCTGGWIAKCCTDLAGSSDWFEGGIVSYSNALKQSLLGVQTRTLQEHGAVSRACAIEMVAGAVVACGVDLAVAVTGIAGPGGGTPGKPVGTVWFGWQRAGLPVETQRVVFSGDREAVRRQTAAYAFDGLLRLLDGL